MTPARIEELRAEAADETNLRDGLLAAAARINIPTEDTNE